MDANQNARYVALISERINQANEYAGNVLEHFEAELSVCERAFNIIENYYNKVIHQKTPKTVGVSAAYIALKDEKPLLAKKYLRETFKINPAALNGCIGQLEKLIL
jgi:hypothetical protein